MKIVITDQ